MSALIPPSQVGSSLHGVTPAEHEGKRTVVLTFDDGPRRGHTDAVADALESAKAKATFFTLIVRARAERRLLADLLTAGHEIALHGIDHCRLTHAEPARLFALLRDARYELEDYTGQAVRFFRPPYGAQNRVVWQATVGAGLVPVVWQRECREWDVTAPKKGLAGLDHLEPGMIVLAHDTVALPADGAEPFDTPPVSRAAFATAVLARIGAQGLFATSLGRALRTGAPDWRVWLEPHQSTTVAAAVADIG